MKKILRTFWGCIPAAFVLLCIIIIVTVNLISGDTLRIVPLTVLIIVGVISFGLLLACVSVERLEFSSQTLMLGLTVIRSKEEVQYGIHSKKKKQILCRLYLYG